jgi:hypothetical protein
MKRQREPKQPQEPHPENDEDAPSPKDIYVFLVILVGALLVTAVA